MNEHIALRARDGVQLEGLLQVPHAGGRHPAVVITHSHSLQAGGHMDAHGLRTIAELLVQHRIPALRVTTQPPSRRLINGALATTSRSSP